MKNTTVKHTAFYSSVTSHITCHAQSKFKLACCMFICCTQFLHRVTTSKESDDSDVEVTPKSYRDSTTQFWIVPLLSIYDQHYKACLDVGCTSFGQLFKKLSQHLQRVHKHLSTRERSDLLKKDPVIFLKVKLPSIIWPIPFQQQNASHGKYIQLILYSKIFYIHL